MGTFEPLGFTPAYECIVSPHLDDGRDDRPSYTFGPRAGSHDNLVVSVTTQGGRRWRARFAPGLGGAIGAFACPNSDHLLVVNEGDPYLIDTTKPWPALPWNRIPVQELVPLPDADLLVLVHFVSLAAIGRDGAVWTSKRLCMDWLKVLGTDATRVRCEGDFPEGRMPFVVDLHTGTQVDGARLPPSFAD
jgi:hypothetical protein